MAEEKRTTLHSGIKKPRTDTAIDRAPREVETREVEDRPSDTWVPPSVLPVPNPIPGWTFRYIRVSSLNQADNTNVSRRFREGWVPCKIDDHPEIQAMPDIGSQFEGDILYGGLLLCKAPDEMIEQRRAYHQKKAAQQMESVDQSYMRENDPRMPLLEPERRSRTQFGKG